jgi:hypothetical protein
VHHQVAYNIFGYTRGKLDGKNVSILMPQPFSGKHDGFLHNYLSTGQAKILNSMRDVVALRKVRVACVLMPRPVTAYAVSCRVCWLPAAVQLTQSEDACGLTCRYGAA